MTNRDIVTTTENWLINADDDNAGHEFMSKWMMHGFLPSYGKGRFPKIDSSCI